MKKIFEVWTEGARATGSVIPAKFLGRYPGNDFQEACEAALKDLKWDMSFYNKKENTYWACDFFDNEVDAKKAFG